MRLDTKASWFERSLHTAVLYVCVSESEGEKESTSAFFLILYQLQKVIHLRKEHVLSGNN